jgi:hypothetical protein
MTMTLSTIMLAQAQATAQVPAPAQVQAPVDAAALAAAAQANAAAITPPQPVITAEQVAAYVDPQQVAAYLPTAPSQSDAVIIFNDMFNIVEAAVISSMFLAGMFLLARIIHAWMIHRSVRTAIEAKSGDASALIDKLNKPYELNEHGAPRPKHGDDRIALVLIAIGLAIAGFGVIQGSEAGLRTATGAALFPLFVGAALVINRRMQHRAMAAERAHDRGQDRARDRAEEQAAGQG